MLVKEAGQPQDASPHGLGGRWGREVGRGWGEALENAFPTRPGTKGRKRLEWALRTTDKLGGGRPSALPGTVGLPLPLPSTLARDASAPPATTGTAKGGSGRDFRPGCRRWAQRPRAPTAGEPRPQQVPWAQRPRWGSRGHVRARETQTATSKAHRDLSARSFPLSPTLASNPSGSPCAFKIKTGAELGPAAGSPPHPVLLWASCPGRLALFAVVCFLVRFFKFAGMHLLLLIVASPTGSREPGHLSHLKLFVDGMDGDAGEGRSGRSKAFGDQTGLRSKAS